MSISIENWGIQAVVDGISKKMVADNQLRPPLIVVESGEVAQVVTRGAVEYICLPPGSIDSKIMIHEVAHAVHAVNNLLYRALKIEISQFMYQIECGLREGRIESTLIEKTLELYILEKVISEMVASYVAACALQSQFEKTSEDSLIDQVLWFSSAVMTAKSKVLFTISYRSKSSQSNPSILSENVINSIQDSMEVVIRMAHELGQRIGKYLALYTRVSAKQLILAPPSIVDELFVSDNIDPVASLVTALEKVPF